MYEPVIEYESPEKAWKYATNYINLFGNKVITEDRKLTKEIKNMLITVHTPCKKDHWPIKSYGWTIEGLDAYAEQLMNPENVGFDYTYGNRLRSYISHDKGGNIRTIDQINNIINQLNANESTRRAVAITWYPGDVYNTSNNIHVPCMILIEILYRNDHLDMTAVFRSHDIYRAWPANVYGLSKILEYVSEKTGKSAGSITTFSISAHIYME